MTPREASTTSPVVGLPPRLQIRRLEKPGDLGWVVMTHGEVYAQQFGWNTDFEVLVAQIVADYAKAHDDEREAAWIAELDGDRVGCVFCLKGDDESTARLRILLVHPQAQGHGAGSALVRTCVDFAGTSGYQRMTLWTNDVLSSARRIYESAGFHLVDTKPHDSFGQNLVGQTWDLNL